MSDAETGTAPTAKRRAWLRDLRRVDERQEDDLAGNFDAQWGEIEPLHHTFVRRLLSRLPPDGRVLDAACGTGKYFPDGAGQRSPAARGRPRWRAAGPRRRQVPQVPTDQHDLQDLPYRDEFDGVLCMDAMEFIPPEEWPPVLERFHQALRPGGWLYLTVELAPDDRVRAGNQAARRRGFRWWMARSSGRGPTATTITTRA